MAFGDYDRPKKDLSNENYVARIAFDIPPTESFGARPRTNVIKAYLPENFQIQFQSEFNQPFAQGIVPSELMTNVAKLAGYSVTTQSMSVSIWQGTSPMAFNLTFIFVAENNPVTEVVEPISILSKLALPGRIGDFGGLLTPPGPRLNVTKIDPEQLLQGIGNATSAIAGSIVRNTTGAITGSISTAVRDFVSDASKAAGNLSSLVSEPLKNPLNNISLRIGNFLFFRSVFIESVSQTYDTAFDSLGRPIKASVDVSFKTLVIPTKADVDEIFNYQNAGEDFGLNF